MVTSTIATGLAGGSIMEVTTIGIELAKDVFELHGLIARAE
jgi:hypothetical protein